MNENKRATKAAGVIGSATLLSRILGFIRDMVIAWFFGAGRLSDAFFVAFRIPNLLRRLLAEGTLNMAFVPVFTEYLARDGRQEAFRMARSAFRLLSAILVLATLAGIVGAPWLVSVLAPGFTGAKFALTVTLTRIIFPYIFFICIVALSMGILNALGHFAAPAFAPVLLNMAIIAGMLFISPFIETPVIGLAVGVLIGGVLQVGLQVPFLIQKGFYFWRRAGFYHPGLSKIGRLMGPSVFGAAIYQINIVVGTLLASLLAEGSVSALYYADRLVQFPLGLFAISISVAVLPGLSRQAAGQDFTGLADTFAYAVRLIFFITLPAMIGLIVLRRPIVALLFGRGAFDTESIRMTAYALFFYGIGLWAFSGVRIVVATFYAIQDTKTPVKTGIISVAANIVLGLFLMGPLAHGGIALATSLASILNFGLLVLALPYRLGQLPWKKIIVSVIKSVICSAVMGGILYGGYRMFPPDYQAGTLILSGYVLSAVAAGMVIYAVSALVLQRNEVKAVFLLVKKH
ncbi:MAG: murein biosynthesis integral membrane protein MurJ [Thermodesulfobacteriota bacterium]